jgi:ABC-type dipeptide/oligopeptide/nickel transport system ATPase subunit
VYAEFLNHFVDGRITDIEYILDWLSTSIRNKNQTFLIASGASGAGKGTFSKILKMLHGVDTNSVEIAGASLKSQFNKNLWGKTLVYVNEFQFIAGETAQKIKTFIDDDINIELKGVDSFKSTNYASYYFTTNKLEIELDDSDRRYSFIDLTTKTWDFAKTGPLLAPENIKQLAYFLWHRNVDESKNAKPHSSATRDFAKRVQYTDWQVYLIEEFFTQYAGKVISISNLLSFLKSKAFKLNTKQLKTWIRETHSKAKIITASPSIATIFLDENSLAITTDSSKQTSKALETDLCQIL